MQKKRFCSFACHRTIPREIHNDYTSGHSSCITQNDDTAGHRRRNDDVPSMQLPQSNVQAIPLITTMVNGQVRVAPSDKCMYRVHTIQLKINSWMRCYSHIPTQMQTFDETSRS